ncbi:hypothetical protein [Salinigranum sp. GCM10025319]|uniref:hypothetical protein n=1 Tax=Salinigranum sp. GCM10025319 TaxID=3252687 RepID=UPI00361E38AD
MVGVPDESLGERVGAAVELRDGVDSPLDRRDSCVLRSQGTRGLSPARATGRGRVASRNGRRQDRPWRGRRAVRWLRPEPSDDRASVERIVSGYPWRGAIRTNGETVTGRDERPLSSPAGSLADGAASGPTGATELLRAVRSLSGFAPEDLARSLASLVPRAPSTLTTTRPLSGAVARDVALCMSARNARGMTERASETSERRNRLGREWRLAAPGDRGRSLHLHVPRVDYRVFGLDRSLPNLPIHI